MPAIAGLIVLYLAAVSFLNPLAFGSVIIGALAILEYRRMKKQKVDKSYRKLKYIYIISGILLILSLL